MPVEYNVPIYLSLAFATLTAVSITALFSAKRHYRKKYARTLRMRETLVAAIGGGEFSIGGGREAMEFIREYARLRDEIEIPAKMAARVQEELERTGLRDRFMRMMKSGSKARRLEAAALFSLCDAQEAGPVLTEAFKKERTSVVRFQIAHSLARLNIVDAIPMLVETLRDGAEWYTYRMTEILILYGSSLGSYLGDELDAGNEQVFPLTMAFSLRYMTTRLREHIIEQAQSDGRYAAAAAKLLCERYPEFLREDRFLCHPNAEVRGWAWEAFAQSPGRETLTKLAEAAGDPSLSSRIQSAIAETVRRMPVLLPALYDLFETELAESGACSVVRLDVLSSVLASRMDYFIYGGGDVAYLLRYLIKRKRVADIESFLQTNKNEDIEATIVERIRGEMDASDAPELAARLDPRILEKLGIAPAPQARRRNPLTIDASGRALLWGIMAASVFGAPLVFILFFSRPGEGLIPAAQRYIIGYASLFAYYSIAINGIYLALLGLSVAELIRELRIWSQARTSFLTTQRMMSPVSIIVPAFREEDSIVESLRAILSLNYPQFEVVVVCDGSPDKTLERIIQAYSMSKSDYRAKIVIPSAPIRGVYKSEKHPFLTVVDKANGGKADALNAGINFAKHDYLCCVDADSLLQSDALTKMMYQIVAEEREMVACGGNIIPVNDCEVRMGTIRAYRPPRKAIARLQTVEYLRAFLAGRLGWTAIDSLMVISGAFGLFRRQRVLEIGGYLTGEAKGKFDTVGEDMELVVRLSRHMHEKKKAFKIGYAFNANCWTEVPEDAGSLGRQRSRWHRGLLEILLYHRRCAFNPKYGTMGMIALPYFFIFETIGPFFEFFGWLSVPLAAVFGLLNGPLAALLFVATVIFGISISTAALAISEFQVMYYASKQTLLLLAFSILENFGFRQWMSFSRVFAFFDILRGKRGWGSMKRKGFAAKQSPPLAS